MLVRVLGVLAIVMYAPAASARECRVVHADFLPAESPNPDVTLRRPLQIVVWLEDAAGHYLQTVYITQETGRYGLGNRPGRFDFNSGPGWPYGKRTTVFPVWAHRKLRDDGSVMTFPQLEFQNGEEDNLSHAFEESSREPRYCSPHLRNEEKWDTGSCASQAYTDKGLFSGTQNLYPPRRDINRTPGIDSPSVDMFSLLNPFDAVSAASPPSGTPATIIWPLSSTMPVGPYVVWIEVAREFDQNVTYDFASPVGISYSEWGLPYRGQPSVIYKVPFTLGTVETTATTMDYAGYSDPDGLDGDVRDPDGTITTDTPGSGAARFALVPGGNYRVKITARPERDDIAPADPADLIAVSQASRAVTLSFVAPGDDGTIGTVKAYEIRYRVGEDITADNFDSSLPVPFTLEAQPAGTEQEFTLDKLLPETDYSVGVRAVDDCENYSAISSLHVKTAARVSGEVDACFIATAAYGSLMAADVEPLRRFRDLVLEKSVLGELFVESYYTFGPAVAGVVGESDLLRATARDALAPLVGWVKGFRL